MLQRSQVMFWFQTVGDDAASTTSDVALTTLLVGDASPVAPGSNTSAIPGDDAPVFPSDSVRAIPGR